MNSLKQVYIRDYVGDYYRSFDYGLHGPGTSRLEGDYLLQVQLLLSQQQTPTAMEEHRVFFFFPSLATPYEPFVRGFLFRLLGRCLE